jgi:MoaA/NifB/PqqE/SkfB family radical SAM enzyme
MNKGHIWPAWARILQGGRPLLSIEITRECPLRCPGCYAYDDEHLGTAGSLRNLSDLRGDALVEGVLGLVRRLRPIHVSIVGGEPLVRHRELSVLLPILSEMGLEVQLVTSAVRPIPLAWNTLPNINVSVSVDGLQPEHDKRRAPATYDRILKHITGHRIRVHCVVTRQQVQRRGYLKEFADFWSKREEVLKIWFSLYTPQQGEESEERLMPQDRNRAVTELIELRSLFPKVDVPKVALAGFLKPPQKPEECLFAQTTACVSADLATRITPCQLGGRPVCAECGCIASAGLAGMGQKKLAGMVSVADIFSISAGIGKRVSRAA